MQNLSFSVRADLFRIAQGIAGGDHVGVRIEPMRDRGVLLIGSDGESLIVIADRSGEASRGATLAVSKAMLNLAVDLFRRDGVETRLQGNQACASITPDIAGHRARDIEVGGPYADWRRICSRHAGVQLQPPFVFDARQAKRIGDAAIGLARVADRDEPELFELRGGMDGATVVVFPAWDGDAFAIFARSAAANIRAAFERSTLWVPPDFARVGALGAV